jgi:ATP/maltotriose-dependent transcriptional regulator MalT
MNAHTGTLTRMEERTTMAGRRGKRPHRPVGKAFEAAERQTSGGMLSDAGSSLEQWVAVLRAAMRLEDVERLRADAKLAAEQLAPGSSFRSAALHLLEVADLLTRSEGFLDTTAANGKERSHGEDLETIHFRIRLAASLTAAELRLLPFLATYLSFQEIGERLYISRHTVKKEAISAYRKLRVSSRSEAVERAVELGLIEAAATTGAGDLARTTVLTHGQLRQLTPTAVVALVASGLTPRTEARV